MLDTLLIPPDGGLQELSGHFENQKVMYGFCSVKDSQAALPKYVLIKALRFPPFPRFPVVSGC